MEANVTSVLKGSLRVKFMTFNIGSDSRTQFSKRDEWTSRKTQVVSIILQNDCDIVGLQGGTKTQILDLTDAFKVRYLHYHSSPSTGTKEVLVIFFKKKFKLLDKGMFWLTETPDEPPRIRNKGWDSVVPRYCTWVKLTDPKSAKSLPFYTFNVHFDWGRDAKLNSCFVIREYVDIFARQDVEGALCPIVLLADLNSVPKSVTYYTLVKGPLFCLQNETKQNDDEDESDGEFDDDEDDIEDFEYFDTYTSQSDTDGDNKSNVTYMDSFCGKKCKEIEKEMGNGGSKKAGVADYIFVCPTYENAEVHKIEIVKKKRKCGRYYSKHRPLCCYMTLRASRDPMFACEDEGEDEDDE